MGHAETIRVEVVYCPGPQQVDLVSLVMPAGATLWQAVQSSGLLHTHRLDAAQTGFGVWGKVQAPDTLLRDRDRVELYRPLLVDPKEARRQRYHLHKASLQARRDAAQARAQRASRGA